MLFFHARAPQPHHALDQTPFAAAAQPQIATTEICVIHGGTIQLVNHTLAKTQSHPLFPIALVAPNETQS